MVRELRDGISAGVCRAVLLLEAFWLCLLPVEMAALGFRAGRETEA